VDHLGEISVPTLIVIGEYDIADVHAHGGALEAGIPGARRVIIPGAGHLVPMESPEEFNSAVLGFLRASEFHAALQAGDAVAAAGVARRLRRSDPEFVPASEAELNMAGYRLLQEGKPGQAVEIFKLNAELHPRSWNAWDSLGEGQAAAGEIEPALASYRRSLALNPDNENGRAAIEQLEQRRRQEKE
jgi:tetratricopeptide (TPR) repeat protein